MKTAQIFADNLRRMRKAKFDRQEDFYQLAGFDSVRGYQKYEQGESAPTPEILDRFAKALGCEPWALIMPKNQKRSSDIDLFTSAAEFFSRFANAPPHIQKVVLSIVYKDASYLEGVPRVVVQNATKLLESIGNS